MFVLYESCRMIILKQKWFSHILLYQISIIKFVWNKFHTNKLQFFILLTLSNNQIYEFRIPNIYN